MQVSRASSHNSSPHKSAHYLFMDTMNIELPVEDVDTIIVALEYYRDNVTKTAVADQFKKFCTGLSKDAGNLASHLQDLVDHHDEEWASKHPLTDAQRQEMDNITFDDVFPPSVLSMVKAELLARQRKEMDERCKAKLKTLKQDGVDEVEIYLADHQHLLDDIEINRIRDYLMNNLDTLINQYINDLNNCDAFYELESMTWQAVIEQAIISSPPLQTRLAVGKNGAVCGTHK